jgi:N5-(carboxyethyl)ornithine synthase
MKKNAMIIDVSCDRNGGIETSIPTTIENPTYIEDGIMHYVVDHTPALFYKTFSINNSEVILPYIERLMKDEPDDVLKESLIIENGKIIDQSINIYQNR